MELGSEAPYAKALGGVKRISPILAPEIYAEFEECTKSNKYNSALEHLKKAAKRHGIAL